MSTTSEIQLQGHVEEGFSKVADVFRENFEEKPGGSPGEVGAACCVYVDGRPVVDVWGGLADREANRPWDKDTLSTIASATKGATSICAHLLVQRGLLDLEAPVVEYWPEFGQAGKEKIPVRWLLSHQAGLPLVDGPLTFEEACAWEPVIRALEKQKPEWEPGTEHAYHAITFGYLVGELVRRISGKSLGTFFHDEVAAPLGLRAWIGLPEEEEKNVQKMHFAKEFSIEEMLAGMAANLGLDQETVTAWVTAAWGPGSVGARAGSLGGAFDNAIEDYFSRAYHAAEFGDSGLVTDARSLARMYAATVSEVDGVRLLEPETVERMIEVQTDKTRMHGLPEGLNVPADHSFYMSLGFWRSSAVQRWLGPRSFGHPGSGGSVGFADPDARAGFAYTMNLSSFFIGEPRAQNLADAVVDCLG